MYKFLTILLIQVLCGMEMDLFIPSFPELQRIFNLTPWMVQLTISVNFVAMCICALYAGALGDRYDRRQILLWGMLLFVIGSIFCVLAPNFNILIFGRALQGVGISAPAILSFPILLEDYPSSKQASVMGMINGVKTLAMAIAPVIGSLVNFYFNWRGNFAILLGLGLICLITSYFFIPAKKGNTNVSLTLKTYLPLLKSENYLMLTFSLALLTAAYWVFLGMAPIFYMEGMSVPLKHFGYYQGALSLTFAIVSILSPKIYQLIGQKKSLYMGVGFCFISAIFILLLSLLNINNPIMISAVLILLSMGIVFPINIGYPLMLEILPDSRGRAAGLGQSILLLLTGLLLELTAYFYHGKLMPIGVIMVSCIMLSLFLGDRIKRVFVFKK